MQTRHDQEETDAEERKRLLQERRAIRRIREELLDNKHVLTRIPEDLDELLSLKFHAWSNEQTTLLELDDPNPHLDASAAYRELYGLCRGRVCETDWGEQHTYGNPPSGAEFATVEAAIDKAGETLLAATGDGQ